MRVFVLGDTHCNERFLSSYVYPTASRVGANAIVQLGDYGYWEHERQGVEFLDANAFEADRYGIPLYWLRGNHDNIGLALAKYDDNVTMDGFRWCRPGVNHIPDGHLWSWAGHTFRAFGGAYSVDKEWRLDEERRRYAKALAREEFRRRAGSKPEPVPSMRETLWFSGEQMDDTDMQGYLAEHDGPVEVIFSHDKPRASRPPWNRKDYPECLPNQDRLQQALEVHQPAIWLHGHLHLGYADTVRTPGGSTLVVGLAPDDRAAPRFWRPTDSWCLLDFDTATGIAYTAGADALEQDERKGEAA